ncbi:hypothetical protein [Cardinium endosymbiont of Dermatophagoides farinae]|uniref:hypothetical protein n=1 Tax=Cardinium endosymbiont of Dermatophagoides farinae TaxID=2597823 RepID=UPI001CB99C08|nr:hypothetical protein [Cardinium endosymbiont of Dermatophagoides farinae]
MRSDKSPGCLGFSENRQTPFSVSKEDRVYKIKNIIKIIYRRWDISLNSLLEEPKKDSRLEESESEAESKAENDFMSHLRYLCDLIKDFMSRLRYLSNLITELKNSKEDDLKTNLLKYLPNLSQFIKNKRESFYKGKIESLYTLLYKDVELLIEAITEFTCQNCHGWNKIFSDDSQLCSQIDTETDSDSNNDSDKEYKLRLNVKRLKKENPIEGKKRKYNSESNSQTSLKCTCELSSKERKEKIIDYTCKKCVSEAHWSNRVTWTCECFKVITTKRHQMDSKISAHKKMHPKKGEKGFKCKYCPVRFKHKGKCTSHEINIHNETQQFPCEFCKKSFVRKEDLQNHIHRVHKNIKKSL